MNGVTYLSELPELDALERGPRAGGPIPDMGDPGGMGMGKFIRNSYNRPVNEYSGMYDAGPPGPPQPGLTTGSMADSIGAGGYHMPVPQSRVESVPDFDENGFENQYSLSSDTGGSSKQCECNCMDVYDHVNLCPICKAFYMQGRNNTILYVIIAALILLSGYMGKRLYDIQLKRAR
jgi:hypothetical protein